MTDRVANVFVDPNGVRAPYSWSTNHSTEDPMSKNRNVKSSAPTGLVGLIQQQGDPDPLVLSWKGSIFTRTMFTEMLAWFQLCKTQTIYLYDFAGEGMEVTWTSFQPQRVGTPRNMRDPTNAPMWFWQYTAQFTVLTFLQGPWAAVGVQP